MVDSLRRFFDNLGLMQRLQQEQQSLPHGTLFGHDVGDTPVLGGLLRPYTGALQGGGMTLEALQAIGQSIAGTAALPAVALQAQANDNSPLTQYAQTMLAPGVGNYLAHPRQQIAALRTSPDKLTSYLAGILEMGSDPTNVALSPLSGAMEASRGAAAVARAGAGAKASQDFLTATANEQALVGGREQAVQAGKDKVSQLLDQLNAAKTNTADKQFDLNEYTSYYKEARGAVANELKAARARGEFQPYAPLRDPGTNRFVYNPENAPIKAANEARRKDIVQGVLKNYPGGPVQGQDYHAYLRDPRQALYQARSEEDAITKLYNQAVKEAPQPVKYDLSGNPLGRKDKMFPRKPNINDQLNSEMATAQAGLPVDNTGAQLAGVENVATTGLPTTANVLPPPAPGSVEQRALGMAAMLGRTPSANEIQQQLHVGFGEAMRLRDYASGKAGVIQLAAPVGPLDSPQAIKQAVDDLGRVIAAPAPNRNIVPEDTRGFTSRMSDLLGTALKAGVAEQKAAMGRDGVLINFSQLASIWKGQAVQTVRNIFMDEAFGRVISWDAGIRQAQINQSKDWLIKRLSEAGGQGSLGESNPLLMLGDVSDLLAANGLGGKLKPKEIKAILDNIGISPLDAETDNIKNLSAMQQLLGNTAVGLANPLRSSVGLLAMPLGYLAPMRQRMFHIVNTVTHMASKGEAFEQGYLPFVENSAKELFRLAEAEGKDVSALRGFGIVDKLGINADGMLLHEGAFSPEAVRMVLGDRYATEWQTMLDQALQAGYARANEVFGNYAARGALEKQINKFVPFMAWSWRAYPRVAKMVLAHPAITAGVLQLYEAELQQAKQQHLPGYLATTVGFNKDTPIIGTLARVFSPDQEASVHINPIALFTPVPSEGLAALTGDGTDTGNSQTLYQQVKGIAGIAGLSPNPLIQAGAYATGQDYQSPSPLSRYANIDQMWNDLGIPSPVGPSIAYGPLHAARKAFTGQADNYDPIVAKAKELVFEDTGHPLSDPRNRFIAAAIANGDSPYLTRAEKIVDVGGAGRTAFNAISPESVSVRSDTTAARQAEGQPPFSYDEIKAMKAISPATAAMMQETVDKWYLQHPAAAVNKNAKITAADKAIARGAQKRAMRQAMGIQ